MTLDQAIDNFRANSIDKTAANLIQTAIQYWNDAMITDNTLASYLREVAIWLERY